MAKNLLNLCHLWETKKTAYQGVCQEEKNVLLSFCLKKQTSAASKNLCKSDERLLAKQESESKEKKKSFKSVLSVGD